MIGDAWRYQSGNPIRRADNTMTKRKRTKNYLQSITLKTKYRATRTPLKLMCSGRIISSFCTCGTGCVTLVTILVISHQWGKDRIIITTNGTYLCHLWHRYSVAVNQVMVATVTLSKWWLHVYGWHKWTARFQANFILCNRLLYLAFVIGD